MVGLALPPLQRCASDPLSLAPSLATPDPPPCPPIHRTVCRAPAAATCADRHLIGTSSYTHTLCTPAEVRLHNPRTHRCCECAQPHPPFPQPPPAPSVHWQLLCAQPGARRTYPAAVHLPPHTHIHRQTHTPSPHPSQAHTTPLCIAFPLRPLRMSAGALAHTAPRSPHSPLCSTLPGSLYLRPQARWPMRAAAFQARPAPLRSRTPHRRRSPTRRPQCRARSRRRSCRTCGPATSASTQRSICAFSLAVRTVLYCPSLCRPTPPTCDALRCEDCARMPHCSRLWRVALTPLCDCDCTDRTSDSSTITVF